MYLSKQTKAKADTDWSKDILKKIIVDGDVKLLNDFCCKIGKKYKDEKLSTSQIRNILNEIQNMKTFNESQLHLLRYKLAYVAGRHLKTRVIKDHLQPMLEAAIQMVNADNFCNFKNFVEAIVAYHRFHGGK